MHVIYFSGITLMHPSYPRPISVSKQIKFVNILRLEKYKNFESIRDMILSKNEGEYTLLPQNVRNTLNLIRNILIILLFSFPVDLQL